MDITAKLIRRYGPEMRIMDLAELFSVEESDIYEMIDQAKMEIRLTKGCNDYTFPTVYVADQIRAEVSRL